ncbi:MULTISPECIES: hypothetical protein [unclassified Actinoplanes]|uniref:hypothetical protein n=1 Tax=unclassified Actinoplanes TaxID=2626549 RepID=UPI00069508DE|nr:MULTISPECIES: hypothetical protein [unclassified Actinoplanes]
MSAIVARVLNALFRSRWGVALVLVTVVMAVVGVGRLLSSGNSNSPIAGLNPPSVTVSIDPSEDDSVISSDPPPKPRTSPGRAQPEAVAYAFASAWASHTGVTSKAWLDRLLPNATTDLENQLRGADPAGVPANQVIGRPTLEVVNETQVNAAVTMDKGRLSLRLIASSGHWLVDGIDWEAT